MKTGSDRLTQPPSAPLWSRFETSHETALLHCTVSYHKHDQHTKTPHTDTHQEEHARHPTKSKTGWEEKQVIRAAGPTFTPTRQGGVAWF